MTIITDPLFYALAIPAVVALGLSKGGFAGVGQMATPLLALFMPPLEAAAIMLPIMIVQDAAALWVYRKDWNGRILAIMTARRDRRRRRARAAGGLYFRRRGARLHRASSPSAMCCGPGSARRRSPSEAGNPAVASGVFWGAVSGFTSTIGQAGAPPYPIYVLAQRLPKMIFVGTTADFFAGVNWMKVVPYLALGQFSAKGFATSLVLLPLAVVTNLLGFWLVRITPQETFYRIMYALMFVISLELLREGVLGLMRG